VAHREDRLPRIVQRRHDQVAGVGVEVRRDLAVEVSGQPVTDEGLDQPLVPVGRRGVEVEQVDRSLERRHRLERVGAELADPVVEPADVPELQARHLHHLDLVADGGRELGVVGEPLERRELAVRDRTEQVDHGEAVVGVVEDEPRLAGRLVDRGVVRPGTDGRLAL
jgi:hypothetical protein